MADPIPPTNPQAAPQARSTVLVQPTISQWEALKSAGWWTPYDWAMIIALGLVWVSGFYWVIFGSPGTTGFIILLLASLSLKAIWLISLVFRCSWFVLRLNADVATLPQEAARIAVAYLSGKPPQDDKK